MKKKNSNGMVYRHRSFHHIGNVPINLMKKVVNSGKTMVNDENGALCLAKTLIENYPKFAKILTMVDAKPDDEVMLSVRCPR